MFNSIREVLKSVSVSKTNKVDANIAEIIIRNADQNIFLRSKELAAKAFVSESSLTAFSKRIGYDGYREVYIRLMVESEYYNYFTNSEMENKVEIESEFDHNIFINEINSQFENIRKIADNIKRKNKLYIFASYEAMYHGQLVANALWDTNNVFFSSNRKTDRNYLNKITDQDEVLVLLIGLDNGELFEHLKTLDNKLISYDVIGSSSQVSKLKQVENSNIIVFSKTANHNKKARSLIRSSQINYTLTHLISML